MKYVPENVQNKSLKFNIDQKNTRMKYLRSKYVCDVWNSLPAIK